jgi:hypothetical protein
MPVILATEYQPLPGELLSSTKLSHVRKILEP